MIDPESEMNLAADVPAVAAFLTERGGEFLPDPNGNAIYWLQLRPLSDAEQTYFVRVLWERYPHRPPSVKFADRVGGSLTISRAWPIIPGYRPGSFDICMPFTSEGFALHGEWNTGPHAWRHTGNPFLWVATRIQDDLNSDSYGGRFT